MELREPHFSCTPSIPFISFLDLHAAFSIHLHPLHPAFSFPQSLPAVPISNSQITRGILEIIRRVEDTGREPRAPSDPFYSSRRPCIVEVEWAGCGYMLVHAGSCRYRIVPPPLPPLSPRSFTRFHQVLHCRLHARGSGGTAAFLLAICQHMHSSALHSAYLFASASLIFSHLSSGSPSFSFAFTSPFSFH